VCAQLDRELAELPEEERAEMLEPLGLMEPAANLLARAAYRLLGLQSFYTANPKEIRAWPIRTGATALEAAGVVHSDMQRGFIRAEVFSVADIEELGSEKAMREVGRLRVEGRDYVMQVDDVARILFNV
jgi:ribosome-binding ATPase YchF (GTP1/OBG family)